MQQLKFISNASLKCTTFVMTVKGFQGVISHKLFWQSSSSSSLHYSTEKLLSKWFSFSSSAKQNDWMVLRSQMIEEEEMLGGFFTTTRIAVFPRRDFFRHYRKNKELFRRKLFLFSSPGRTYNIIELYIWVGITHTIMYSALYIGLVWLCMAVALMPIFEF